jgi:hypothetical protein
LKSSDKVRQQLDLNKDDIYLYTHISASCVQDGLGRSWKERESLLPRDDANVQLILHTLTRLLLYKSNIKWILSCDHLQWREYVGRVIRWLKKENMVYDRLWSKLIENESLILTSTREDNPLELLGACDLYVDMGLGDDVGGLALLAMSNGIPTLLPMNCAYESLYQKVGEKVLYERVPSLPLTHKHWGERYMVVNTMQLCESILKCTHDIDGLKSRLKLGVQALQASIHCEKISKEFADFLYYLCTTYQHPSYPDLAAIP